MNRNLVCIFLMLGCVANPGHAVTPRVVGFPYETTGAYVGKRFVVEKGSIIQGVHFYSNDATTYPRVRLAADAGDAAPPRAGATLAAAETVTGDSGYRDVAFPAPYEAPANQYVWVVVELPGDRLTSEGAGGGPGIGLLDKSPAWGVVSIYGTDLGEGVYDTADFDIGLLTQGVVSKSLAVTQEGPRERGAFTLEVSGGSHGQPSVFHLRLREPQRVELTVYDIAGRRVARVAKGRFPAGTHDLLWAGKDAHGRAQASGVYLYRLRIGHRAASGNILRLR